MTLTPKECHNCHVPKPSQTEKTNWRDTLWLSKFRQCSVALLISINQRWSGPRAEAVATLGQRWGDYSRPYDNQAKYILTYSHPSAAGQKGHPGHRRLSGEWSEIHTPPSDSPWARWTQKDFAIGVSFWTHEHRQRKNPPQWTQFVVFWQRRQINAIDEIAENYNAV